MSDDPGPIWRWWWHYPLSQWRLWMREYPGSPERIARMAGYSGA